MYRVLLMSTTAGRREITSKYVTSVTPFTAKGAARLQGGRSSSTPRGSMSVRSGDAAYASSTDRDRMLNFVAEAVKYFIQQTTRRSKVDADSIEQVEVDSCLWCMCMYTYM